MIALDQFRAIMPHLPEAKASAYLAPLNEAMREWAINSPLRVAAFLAQIAHESGELRWWEELGDGTAYDGRGALGNSHPGDGPRFRGRGPIQLTGRKNYAAASAALRLDLIAHPDMVAAIPIVGLSVAGWFWSTHGLNRLADSRDMRGITRIINGGLNGLPQRLEYYDRACKVLGLTTAHGGQGEANG